MNIFSIAKRIILQIHHDKRSLALLIFAPILMLTLLWVVINGSTTRPTIATSGLGETLQQELASRAVLLDVPSPAGALALVEGLKADGAVYVSEKDGKTHVDVDGADPSIAALVMRVYQQAAFAGLKSSMDNAPAALKVVIAKKLEKTQPELTWLHGSKDSNAFDFLAPVMMGFVIFFFIFLLSGISFLREQTTGTMERMLVSPVSRLQVVLGYMLGFGFFAALQTVLIQLFMFYVIGVPTAGSFWAILAVNLALCLTALSLGGLLSMAARNEFQIIQFIPIVIVPQMVFSGLLDLREAPNWVQWLSQVFPLTYAGRALREIMIRGKSLLDVMPDFLIVLAFMAGFIVLNALALRRRKK